MTAPKYAIDDTQPIPRVAYGLPLRTWALGDRVTDTFPDGSGKPRRYVGTVIESDLHIFRIRWDHGFGTATFVHGHEPSGLRAASRGDELTARRDADRVAVVAELQRLAQAFGAWPAEVRQELRRRAAELAGQ